MCYDDGSLQALLDGEVTGREKLEMEKHLANCRVCRQTIADLAQTQSLVDVALSQYFDQLEPTNLDSAWSRFKSSLSHGTPNKRQFAETLLEKGVYSMIARNRAAFSAAAVVLVLALSLNFSSVRAFAGELLSIFRVDRIQTVNITPQDAARIQQALQKGAGNIDLGSLGKIEMNGQGPGGKVSLAEARQAVDFTLKLPGNLPAGYNLQEIRKNPGGTMNFTLDTGKTNNILKALGSSKLLPVELNGQTFTAKIPTVITAIYSGANSQINIRQAKSPELIAPGETSVTAVRDALLALPFIPEDLKRQLTSINDWQHTFLIPNIDGSTQEVSVNGVSGVFITPPAEKTKGRSVPNALVYQKDGVVYAIQGELTQQQALALASSLQ